MRLNVLRASPPSACRVADGLPFTLSISHRQAEYTVRHAYRPLHNGLLSAVATARNGGILLNITAISATVPYVLLNPSNIVLRIGEGKLENGYRTSGGIVMKPSAVVLAPMAIVVNFVVDVRAAGIAAGALVLAIAWFLF